MKTFPGKMVSPSSASLMLNLLFLSRLLAREAVKHGRHNAGRSEPGHLNFQAAWESSGSVHWGPPVEMPMPMISDFERTNRLVLTMGGIGGVFPVVRAGLRGIGFNGPAGRRPVWGGEFLPFQGSDNGFNGLPDLFKVFSHGACIRFGHKIKGPRVPGP